MKAVRTTMRKKSSNMFVTINQRFERDKNKGWTKFIQQKQIELCCKYFGNIFISRKFVDNHIDD